MDQERGIRLLKAEKAQHSDSEGEEDDGNEVSTAAMAELSLDGLSSQEATGAQVYLDEQGALHWPVLFLYPEHRQTDFISAFCENSRSPFITYGFCSQSCTVWSYMLIADAFVNVIAGSTAD